MKIWVEPEYLEFAKCELSGYASKEDINSIQSIPTILCLKCGRAYYTQSIDIKRFKCICNNDWNNLTQQLESLAKEEYAKGSQEAFLAYNHILEIIENFHKE